MVTILMNMEVGILVDYGILVEYDNYSNKGRIWKCGAY